MANAKASEISFAPYSDGWYSDARWWEDNSDTFIAVSSPYSYCRSQSANQYICKKGV